MCQASALFDSLPRVQVGDDVVVADHGGNKLFALPSRGKTRMTQYCCVPSGSTVVIAGLPVRLQKRLEVGSSVVAVMISEDADRIHTHTDRDDEFQIVGTKKKFFLRELEVGTRMRRVNAVVQTEVSDTSTGERPAEFPTPHPVEEHELVAAGR